MIITYRNPLDLNDTIDVHFALYNSDFHARWKDELKKLLTDNYHLEKNYCFMGFVDSPRDVGFLCEQINDAIGQINRFNTSNKWQDAGLESYAIQDHFETDTVMYSADLPIGECEDGKEMTKPGLRIKHDAMNRLHRYFEDLQGEAWGLSQYYKIADHETKYAIRQLNDLCHELENYILSYRKKFVAPEWQRPSQINTWLQAPRSDLQDNDYQLFEENGYDRMCGGIYLHWAQVGKTHIEVFRDEDGKDIDDVVCSSISALQYYSGCFDIEWAQTVSEDEKEQTWHINEQKEFREWLSRNGFDPSDPKLSLGFIKLGQCNLLRSFQTQDPQEIWKIMSKYQDVYKIQIDYTVGTFDYVWSQPDYAQMQIAKMIPGYIHSSKES